MLFLWMYDYVYWSGCQYNPYFRFEKYFKNVKDKKNYNTYHDLQSISACVWLLHAVAGTQQVEEIMNSNSRVGWGPQGHQLP